MLNWLKRKSPEPTSVTMWLEGVSVQVPVEEIGRFEARGFLLAGPGDLEQMGQEVEALAHALAPLVRAFVHRVLTDKIVDPAEDGELHTMELGWHQLHGKLQLLLKTSYGHFPTKAQEHRE